MKTTALEKNKEYAYMGSEFIERVVYKWQTVNGYLFEGMRGNLKAEAVLTASQVNSFIEELCVKKG